jgi:hypothetical protein
MARRLPGWLGVMALLGTGCATITAGGERNQRIDFATDPPGALVTSGEQRCTAPCSLALPRRDDASVHLAKEGFAPQEVRLRSRLRLAAAGDLLFLPIALPLLGVDLAVGTAWELLPPQVSVPLQPADPAAPDASRPPLTLAPRPERLASLVLEAGVASTCGATLFGLGAVLAVPVGGPFVIGGEVFGGETFNLFNSRGSGGAFYGLLGGVETSGDSARGALLLRLGMGSANPEAAQLTTVTLPQAALRGEISLLAADTLLIGLWASAGTELGQRTVANPAGPPAQVGGRIFGIGLQVGFAIRRGERNGPPAAAPATPP